ncbi:TonB-dependent receptor [Flavobacterium sp. DG1-102-2]|uniref:SusC/RagA family TonB-linked outer membrane protein n=1 Tax=Flavobacterium sp. DG1-102-2 TaxID=3081663 RepID=UPI00294A63AC|nr:TonB-dependent receptor [Flavobacterium sp. DG1-102-2]MDV6169655.1 TonB-dependent receptor [Flavobacterium sp. DG1-102-2]
MLLCFSAASFAQQVKGTVTDTATGMTIPGVNILVKGSTANAATDMDGNFTINAKQGDVLVFSYIGYASIEVAATGSTLNVKMKEDAQLLQEVVVVGYGAQRKKDITGAVAVVDGKKFENRVTNQLSSLLQGQTAGVQVTSNGGKPGGSFNVRVRGTSSITAGSDPIYVIDGVITSDTRALNPADIETMSVLKDASSAAIYGSQGGNGVVIITTKQGKSEKPVLTYETYTGFQTIWKKIDVLNADQYKDLQMERGLGTQPGFWDQYNQNTNWQDEVFRTGTSNSHQVSLSGKSNKTAYYLSGSTLNQDGAVRTSEMHRKTFKVNLTQEVTDWLKVGTNFNYVDYKDVDVSDNTAAGSGGVILGVLNTPQNIGIFNPNGTYTSNPFQNWENPVSSTDAAQRGYRSQRVFGNVFGEINILKGLKFRTGLGIDHSNSSYSYFLNPYTTSYGIAMKGISRYNTNLFNYYMFENTLTYKLDVAKHSFEAVAGTVYQKSAWESSELEKRGFAGDGIPTPNAGATIVNATARKDEKYNSSFISRINYSYDDKYLLTANFRADGSSVFGPQEKWGYFPSVSAGWRISNEEFLKSATAVTDLKLRAGWGLVGNDNITNYAWYQRVSAGSNYPIGGVIQPGNYPANIENQNLKWEASEQINVGIDVALFNNRVRFSADAYKKTSKDLLLNVPLPRTSGFDSALMNAGAIENKGLEFQLTTVNFDGEDFKWSTDLNISFNRNKVTNLVGQKLNQGGIAGRGDAILIQEGQPVGQFYGYQWGGVDPATGNVFYIAKDGSSTFNPTDDDKRNIGNANPDFTYGITNTFSYKNFSLNVFFQGSQGNDILNATRFDTESMIDAKNQTTAVLNRWQQAGDITNVPRVSTDGSTNNSRISSHYVEDGSYLRLKALTIGYDLSKTVLDKIGLSALRLYATGENLFTITNYSGFDPEVNFGGTSTTVLGIDYGTYPQTRNIIFGIRASL